MKFLATLLIALSLFAAEPAKPPAPTPLNDSQARQLREAQLAVAMAVINKVDAEKLAQKAIDDAQATLQAKVQAVQKECHCEGCGLSKDLKWEKASPPAEKAK